MITVHAVKLTMQSAQYGLISVAVCIAKILYFCSKKCQLQLGYFIKYYEQSNPSYFFLQLGRIYLDMLNVYKCLSENISAAITQNGDTVMKQPLIRSMRTVKKETLKLISGWVSRATDTEMASNIKHISSGSSSFSVFIRCCPLSRDGRIYPIPSAIARIPSFHLSRLRASSFKPNPEILRTPCPFKSCRRLRAICLCFLVMGICSSKILLLGACPCLPLTSVF